MARRVAVDVTESWEVYVAIEQAMFEAGSRKIQELRKAGLTFGVLEEAWDQACEGDSDVAPLIEMVQGRKEIPDEWKVVEL